MASVTSLDQDMRKLRLERYTPQAAQEVRSWIENTLGEQLPAGDLLDSLKDGVALCKLANLVLPAPGIKYKASSMPFVQMENISHFLKACELPPLRLPSHDRFLTVDLYDNKDPAQVIQCLGAFSRAANAVHSARVPTYIGPKRGATSPTRRAMNGLSSNSPAWNARDRGPSNVGQGSEADSNTPESISRYGSSNVSSWSKRTDESTTMPAWNIHQYGYMGGASQANQGITFGGRRQIVSPSPQVPSLAEKDKRRKDQEHEAERQRKAHEEQQRLTDEGKARTTREREREQLEQEKKQWEEEERRWKEEDERRKAEQEADAKRIPVLGIRSPPPVPSSSRRVTDSDRIRELERQLEEARERERQYQQQREQHGSDAGIEDLSAESHISQPVTASGTQVSVEEDQNQDHERESLQQEWEQHQPANTEPEDVSISMVEEEPPVEDSTATAPTTSSPTTSLPSPTQPQRPASPPKSSSPLPRPLPDPRPYYPASTTTNRTDRFLATNPAPQSQTPRTHYPSEIGMTSASERATEDARRAASQTNTKAGGWASKSLLEREMEKERERQKEWEEAQMERVKAAGQGRSGGLHGPRDMKR